MANQVSPERIHTRAVRMLALVDLAKPLVVDVDGLPGDNDSTDSSDKLHALLAALQSELEALHDETGRA
jgi:hypothetical protein